MADVYELLELIRQRPGVYIGRPSLSLPQAYVNGYQHCASDSGDTFEDEVPPFGHFHDWIARKYGWSESTTGWCNILLNECGSEEAALTTFFTVLDEFKLRRPTVVASLKLTNKHKWTRGTRRYWDGIEMPPPVEVRVIHYATDPGCHVVYVFPPPYFADDLGYFPSRESAIETVRRQLGVDDEDWSMSPPVPSTSPRGDGGTSR